MYFVAAGNDIIEAFFLPAELVSTAHLHRREAPTTTAITVAVTTVSRSRIGRRNRNEVTSKDHRSSLVIKLSSLTVMRLMKCVCVSVIFFYSYLYHQV